MFQFCLNLTVPCVLSFSFLLYSTQLLYIRYINIYMHKGVVKIPSYSHRVYATAKSTRWYTIERVRYSVN